MIASPPPLPRRMPPPLPRQTVVRTLPPLDLGLLADLPTLELRARYMVDGFLAGRHRSPQKGSSVEFAEYRDYQHGDDLRRIDWRLYGRTDRLHVKQFEEETQLRVYLALDTSASMDFRSERAGFRKIEFARLVLAAVGLLAQRQRDAVGLGVAGNGLEEFHRARSSPAHWRRVVACLDAVAPAGETSLAESLESLAELAPPRSMVVVASDFYDDPGRLEAVLRRLRYDRHDVLALHVLDPVEVDFDLGDSGMFLDLETGAGLRMDASAVREGYLRRFGAFCAEFDTMVRDAGGEVVRLRTDRTPLDALSEYLGQRARRLK